MHIQSSFYYQQWIGTWKSNFEQKTVFILPVDPRDESHKDPEHIHFSVPRRARYVHSAWKKHQDAVFWVDIDLSIKEGLTFYQTRSNAIILQGTLPAHCISKVERLKTEEMLYEKRYLSPRPPPKISLKHDHNWTRGNDQSGSTIEQQPLGKLVQQSFTQSKPNPICDQTGNFSGFTVLSEEPSSSCKRFSFIFCERDVFPSSTKTRSVSTELSEDISVKHAHDGTREPVEPSNSNTHKVQEVGSLEHRDDVNRFNLAIDDENIDFNISGVPNAMVKRSHSINVHNLIQQIENHPQRQTLQSDLQQHQAFNPFSKGCDNGCWEHWTMRDSRRGAEITVQSMPNALERWHCILHMWTPYGRWYNRKTRSTSHPCWICFPSRTSTSRRAGHTVTSTGRNQVAKNTTRQINSKKSVERNNRRTFTIDAARIFITWGIGTNLWTKLQWCNLFLWYGLGGDAVSSFPYAFWWIHELPEYTQVLS